ncbi:MAG TPA: hypothetical protein VEJ18_04455, partial [Planctomycetota bacterium]|nr:hypothetical protein [Planctomycetota bacterium]
MASDCAGADTGRIVPSGSAGRSLRIPRAPNNRASPRRGSFARPGRPEPLAPGGAQQGFVGGGHE